MRRIKNNNYYVTNGWMVNELGLNGRELQVYAIIYGFTQDEETEFNGSLNYIAEWLGTSSRHTVTRAIKTLTEKGLITKRQTLTNGVTNNFYKAVIPPPPPKIKGSAETAQGSAKTAQGVCQNSTGGSAKTAQGGSAETAHNIYINKDINKDKDILLVETSEKEALKSEKIPYEQIKKLYNNTCTEFSKIVSLSENRKKAIAARWKEYGHDIAVFEKLFTLAQESNFLKGKNDRNWSATFDWLMKSANMAKVLEGNYRNKGDMRNVERTGNAYTSRTGAEANRTTPGNVRAITTAELEEKLRKEGHFANYPDFDAMFGQTGTAD